MFDTLLIANRGEIACRVMRTARRLGLRSIAVYSEADIRARHVREADEAYLIGAAPAAESYLRSEAIIEAARRGGAQAIHPGYGFLSENAAFAEACAAAGLVFVGPPPAAIRAMGSKSEAKTIMAAAGVPLVPGYHGEAQDPARLAEEAERIGYPVLIKASAGGGGKGMRVVERPADFADQLAAARREAEAAFGDRQVLVEKYLTRPRHIEIQVFADAAGQALYLFERDCSLQRRHQKVVEEAPAPGLEPARRAAMGEAAVAAARAIGYLGAGTVEFICQDDAFYFMEMNTRLQVEHPVTEAITGLDLVEWQLRVAAGQPLPCRQEDLRIDGHAIEARLYAEDPARDFLPATGRLRHLRFPPEGPHLRIDSGVTEGDEISPHYDPMIAKIVAWDHDREAALRRLRRALASCELVGVTTNLGLLSAIAGHPAFAAAELDTGFIARHAAELQAAQPAADDRVLALACVAEMLRRRDEAEALAAASGDPHSPWFRTDGWRLNVETHRELAFSEGERQLTAMVHYRAEGAEIEIDGRRLAAEGRLAADGRMIARLGDLRLQATVVWAGDDLSLLLGGASYRLRLLDPLTAGGEAAAISGHLAAPMPGKVVQVKVAAGDQVEAGAALLILEAMKMEHTITAPAAGRVAAVHYREGETVEEGVELLAFEPGES